MNDSVKKIIESVGALAELAKLFYDSLIKNGFNDKQAMEFTDEFIHSLFTGGKRND